jgi:hypothetical protein
MGYLRLHQSESAYTLRLAGDGVQGMVLTIPHEYTAAKITNCIETAKADGWGRLTRVAEGAEEFKRLMAPPENGAEWFAPKLVGDILSQGARLKPGEC